MAVRLMGIALGMTVGLVTGFVAHAQVSSGTLLLPGDEYRLGDLPEDAAGTWWVLHDANAGPKLDLLPVTVTAFHDECVDEQPTEQSGRAVGVPEARGPIALFRGLPGLETGPISTAFITDGVSGEEAAVSFSWEARPMVVRHVVQGDRYRVELVDGDVTYRLREDEWHGDGVWQVRWIGDLNRDNLVDVLLDASHKYSVHVTRLYLSAPAATDIPLPEVAALQHTAC